jgi:hypothetical protein
LIPSNTRILKSAIMASNLDKVDRDAPNDVPGDIEIHPGLHSDLERSKSITSPVHPKRQQPFSAVWIVIACGFALMSDGSI